MAYTFDEMVRAYTDIHVGRAPTAAMQDNFTILTGLNANGQVSDAQVLSNIVNGVDDSTALAIVSYQFFTGKSPTQEGLAYLVNSTVNANDLNDAYYARFNLENRYINFAANLGVNGQGATAFAAKYGAMSFSDYVASIYETIIGAKYATAAGVDVAAAVAYLIGTKDAVLATVAGTGMIDANSTPAQVDIALKAAMAGLVMAASIKADIGLYAAAADNFMIAIATHTAVYNTDITRTYAPEIMSAAHGTGKAVDRPVILPSPEAPPPAPSVPISHNFSLTTGVDRFTGDSLNDVFNVTETTASLLNPGDVLNGKAGQDTLNIVSTLDNYTLYDQGLGVASVTNIETVNFDIKSRTTGATVDIRTWTGVNQVNATVVGGATGLTHLDFRASGAPDVDVDIIGLGNGGLRMRALHDVNLNITGMTNGFLLMTAGLPRDVVINADHIAGDGSNSRLEFKATGNVRVTQTASNAVGTSAHMSSTIVGGGADTTSVIIHNAPAAVADGAHAGVLYSLYGTDSASVAITDINAGTANVGVLSFVDLDGYDRALIKDSGLTTLKLAHGGGDVNIQNGGAASAPTMLAVSLNAVNGGSLNDQGVYRTFNITTGATGSTLSNISAGALTALNLGGASNLTLTSTAGLSSLQTVMVTGAAGITANLSGATVTAINASASSGANTVTIDPSKATYTGGSGVDRVTYTAAGITKAISLGDGDDFLDISSANGVSGLTADGGAGTGDTLRLVVFDANAQLPHFTNFERLELVNTLGSGFVDLGGVYRHVTISNGNLMTLGGLTTGDTLLLNGAGTSYTLIFNDPNPTLNLQLAGSSGADVNFASNGINAPGLGTLNITTAATSGPNGSTLGNLFTPSLTALNLGGAGELTMASTTGMAALQTVTVTGAAGITANLSSSSVRSVDASATSGDNTVTIDPNTATYVGGSGVDRVSLMGGNIGKAINLGAGDDFLDATNMSSRSSVTVDGGAGTGDTVRLNTATANDLASFFTGFERVELVGAGGTLVHLGVGYNHIAVNGPTNLSLSGVESGATIVLTGPGSSYSVAPATLHASLNLQLKDSSGAGVNFASTGFFVQAFETVNFNITDGQATPSGGFMDTLTLLGSAISKNVNISGNAGVALVSAGSNPATIDASGITLGGFSWTAPSLTGAATIKGSTTGTNTLDFTATSHGVTYTGGTGADIIKVGVGANTIDVGIDNSVDKVLITRETTQTDFITINHLAAGDQIHLPGMGVGFPDPPLTAVVTATPANLMNQIDVYATYATGASAAMFFIQVGSDTYIFEDRSISSFYNPGTDVLIKLTGVTLTGANYDAANALITI